MASNIVLKFPKQVSQVILNHVQRRHMPVNVPPTATGKRRFRLEVETDPHKLVNYCCGLNYIEGSPPVKLKPDNEYPDWLWTLRLGPKANSWDMEKGTKEYYLRLAEEGVDNEYKLRMTAAKPKKITGKVLKDQAEYLHKLRFAALAHLEEDAGIDLDQTLYDWRALNTEFRVNSREMYLPRDENKVIYADKIAGSTAYRSFYRDEECSFKKPLKMQPRPPKVTPTWLDSKRRHQYSTH